MKAGPHSKEPGSGKTAIGAVSWFGLSLYNKSGIIAGMKIWRNDHGDSSFDYAMLPDYWLTTLAILLGIALGYGWGM